MTTVHLWTQIVGKLRLAASPPLNHLWQSALHVTPRRLTTGTMPYRGRLFQVDFDFVDHRLALADSNGAVAGFPLEQMSVAVFYGHFMEMLDSVGIGLRINRRPNEVAVAIPFDEDDTHATYVAEHAHLLWRGFAIAHRLLERFRAPFVGKASRINFFWGSFDLAVSLYSGRPAPLHPGGMPNCPDWVQHEAYSREVAAAGFWPGTATLAPIFYAYAYPTLDGYATSRIEPASASFDTNLGEFVLPYESARTAVEPDEAVGSFLRSTFAAAVRTADWDRSLLAPASYPEKRPPHHAWTVLGDDPC